MSIDDGGLSRDEHDEIRDLVLAGTQRTRRAGTRRGHVVAAGVALLLIGAVAGGALIYILEGRSPTVVIGIPDPRTPSAGTTRVPTPTPAPNPAPTPAPGPLPKGAPIPKGVNGWVAFAAEPPGGQYGIHLIKEGRPARRILRPDDDKAVQSCPAFSPDGKRLVAGQAIGSEDMGWRDAALVITDLTADGQPFDTTTLTLGGLAEHPCAIWSADGRWLALKREEPPRVGEVWVIDTRTNDIRRLTGLEATDLEWSPQAPELFIAGNGITVYSTATGKTRLVDNTSGAVGFALSPDGEWMAVQHDANGDLDGPSDLLLMGADGSNQRTLVANYNVMHGVGPVWSPDGKRVAIQRVCDSWDDAELGRVRRCYEEHEVVVVTVSDHDSGSFGSVTVVAPPKTTQRGVAKKWAPYGVSWSPDSTALLYVAWSSHGHGLLAVPLDTAQPPVLLEDVLEIDDHVSAFNWAQQRG